MKVVVTGPSLYRQGSGLGWVKHNICKTMADQGHDVFSLVPVNKLISSINATHIVSAETRSDAPEDALEIDEIFISNLDSERQWEEVKALLKPDLVICVGDPENNWFVISEEHESDIKLVYYFLSEAHTINRYIPIEGRENINEERLDIRALLEEFDLVIPATETTRTALLVDCGVAQKKVTKDNLLLPVHKWNRSSDAAVQYRRSIQVDPTCKIYYSIGMNTVRKRLDQLLLYFKFHLLRKPCDKLVIHTTQTGAYDLIAIAGRLGIVRNLRIIEKISRQSIEGVMSAGDVYISTPAAEGFGLPLWESLLLAKPVIHTDVGHPGQALPLLGGRQVTLLKADVPYFPQIGNQVWYGIPTKPHTDHIGNTGKLDVEDLVETPKSFSEKFITYLKERNICQ